MDKSAKANQAQNNASNPLTSVWVEASAGTGKTKVLTDRILKILLLGGDISKILCITYTKNSANEMMNRLISVSKKWAVCNDVELKNELQKIISDEPSVEMVAKARTLFAYILEDIGSIKIKTIHSFCEEILKKFPVEAGINPHFKMIDDEEKKGFLQTVLENVLNKNDEQINEACAFLYSFLNHNEFEELQKKIILNTQKFTDIFSTPPDKVREKLKLALNINELDIDKLKIEFIDANHHIFDSFLQVGLTDLKKDKMQKPFELFWKLERDKQVANFNIIYEIFLTKKFEIDKRYKKIIPFAQIVYDFKQIDNSAEIFTQTNSVLTIAFSVLEEYKKQKELLGLMDFDDLILKTFFLLEIDDISSWILFKMNGGISHILLDEAQDTSPLQWKILSALSRDFFETSSGKIDDINKFKSLFIVGDRKQSIYSFQGADIENYQSYLDFFQRQVHEYQYPWLTQNMEVSFRSARLILDFVDKVFCDENIKCGVSNTDIKHEHFFDLNSRIELYPAVKELEKEKQNIYDNHFENRFESSSKIMLAKAVVSKIKNLLDSKIILSENELEKGEQSRYLNASDILILVKKRYPYADYLNKELKNAGIEFEGIDKFQLLNDMAVNDLINIGKFALLPYDELNLAGVFKCPVINGTEAELFELCFDRNDKNLWDRILESNNPEIILKRNIMLAIYDKRFLNPFEFYSFILDELKGKTKLLSHLGMVANDGIGWFLNTAMGWENKRICNLQSFINMIENTDAQITREGEGNNQSGVKIMTVHGSKGLEGRCVFLIDTADPTMPAKDNNLLFDDNMVFYFNDVNIKTEKINSIIEAKKNAYYQEYKRLLYVALTRAKQNIYIFTDKPKAESWYEILKSTFQKFDEKVEQNIPNYLGEFYNDTDKILVLKDESNICKNDIVVEKQAVIKNEDFVYPVLEKVVQKEAESSEKDIDKKAIIVGNKLHDLMQNIVNISKDNRINFANNIIESLDTKEEIKQQYKISIEKVVSEMPWVWEKTIAEQEVIISAKPRPKIYRIDNLIIKDNEVIIIDYKSDIYIDKNLLIEYKKQLENYKQIVGEVFKDKKISAFILWLYTAEIMEV